MPGTGWLPRPDYEEAGLLDTVGYVREIWISQEGQVDELYFRMEIFYPDPVQWVFRIPLYVSTHVAMAQLHLLRDALRYAFDGTTIVNDPLLVRVHFNFVELLPTSDGYVYWLQVLRGYAAPTTVQDYFHDYSITRWYTHVS